jgi:hypothetical protein
VPWAVTKDYRRIDMHDLDVDNDPNEMHLAANADTVPLPLSTRLQSVLALKINYSESKCLGPCVVAIITAVSFANYEATMYS